MCMCINVEENWYHIYIDYWLTKENEKKEEEEN